MLTVERLTNPRFPSKITDEYGFDPTIWYHGTRRRFEQFRDPEKETHKSQIEELGPVPDQLVVFKPEDVRILARHK
jgi:hypothetical protein